jgi:hypothetical protein
MGRFSSMQTFADTNQKSQPVAYEQAAAAPSSSARVIVPKINNTSGSSAGAGSSEFHNYRKLRRWENDRLEALDAEEKRVMAENAFRAKIAANEAEAAGRTRKRAEKRKRHKQRQRDGRSQKAIEDDDDEDDEEEDEDDDDDKQVKEKNDNKDKDIDGGDDLGDNKSKYAKKYHHQESNTSEKKDDTTQKSTTATIMSSTNTITITENALSRAPDFVDDDEDIIRVDGCYSTKISLAKS